MANDFLPFATNVGANVQSQAAYAGDAVRLTGYQRGIAESAKVNKAIRQAAYVAHCITQFMATRSGDDVLDDANTVNFIASLEAALVDIIADNTKVRLTGDTTYYVSTTGSNVTGDGSVGTPWQTLQFAYDYILRQVDTAGYTVTIDVADGTYTAGLVASTPVLGGVITIVGNITTPASCVISVTNANCFTAANGSHLKVSGFKLAATGSSTPTEVRGWALAAGAGGVIEFGLVEFDVCSEGHVLATQGYAASNNNYDITGNSPTHISVSSNGIINVSSINVEFVGSRTFTQYVKASVLGSVLMNTCAFTNTFTGKKYDASLNSVLDLTSTTVPGTVAGTAATGAQVVNPQ